MSFGQIISRKVISDTLLDWAIKLVRRERKLSFSMERVALIVGVAIRMHVPRFSSTEEARKGMFQILAGQVSCLPTHLN